MRNPSIPFFIMIAIILIVVAGYGFHLLMDAQQPLKGTEGDKSFSVPKLDLDINLIGGVEGRSLYQFALDDGTRCLAISGRRTVSLDCDWAASSQDAK